MPLVVITGVSMSRARTVRSLAIAATIAACAACFDTAVSSISSRELEGQYRQVDSQIGKAQGSEELILKGDGTYTQRHKGPQDGATSENTGKWTVSNVSHAVAEFDGLRTWGVNRWGGATDRDQRSNVGLPVMKRDGALVLVINDDLGQYYVKEH